MANYIDIFKFKGKKQKTLTGKYIRLGLNRDPLRERL